MSDFDQFTSAEPAQQEEDPAAEFLAREQDQLAELEGDNFGETEAAPAEDAAFQQQQDTGDLFGGSEDPAAAAAAVGAIDDVLGAFDPSMQPPTDSTMGDLCDDSFGFDSQQQQETMDPYAGVKVMDTQRAEPEKIRVWRENQKEMLEKKDAASEKKKAEWREIAAKELEDWYKHRTEQLEKTKKNNRESEAAFVEERDECQAGHEWERICRLCDFNPKAARNTKDVSRMRSILLQLKQTPLVR